MALETNQLYGAETTVPARPHFQILEGPDALTTKTFAAVTGAPTLSKGHPVAFNTTTNLWVPLDGDGVNGTNVIRGLLGEERTFSATEEVQALVMQKVAFDYEHVITPIIGEIAATDAEMKAQFRSGCRERNIFASGIGQVR